MPGIIARGEDPATAANAPVNRGYAYCQVKPTWSADWQMAMDLIPLTAEVHSLTHGGWKCSFSRKYGPHIKDQWEIELAAKTAQSYEDWWVRTIVVNDEGPVAVFYGILTVEDKKIHGTREVGPSGEQKWVAYGPERILEKKDLYTSFWENGEAPAIELGWHPDFNLRDKVERITGNRSDDYGVDGVYLFSSTATNKWNCYDALRHILQMHVNGPGAPSWTVGGQVNLLKNLELRIPMRRTTNVWDVIRNLAPRAAGIDLKIVPTDDGFAIHPFALTSKSYSFGSYQFEGNPDVMRLQAANTKDRQVTVEVSTNEKYDSVRLVGNRIKSTFTMYAADFRKLWSDDREAAYKAGDTGGAGADDHDGFRGDDQFRDVYQAFGAKTTFDFKGGKALPVISLDGTISTAVDAAFQTGIRRTLSRLPLREGVDYSTNPPTEAQVVAGEPEFLPPIAIIYDERTERHVPVDQLPSLNPDYRSCAVGVLQHDWGVRLRSQPNHLFALNHWSGAADSNFDPDAEGFDWEELVLTICVETDHRLVLGYDLPDEEQSSHNLVKTVDMPDCEFWWLTADTVFATTMGGGLALSHDGNGNGIALRNDIEVMQRAMPGAIARYCSHRNRVTVAEIGLKPLTELLGTIIQAVDSDVNAEDAEGSSDTTVQVDAPITTVHYDFKNTAVKYATGHAER